VDILPPGPFFVRSRPWYSGIHNFPCSSDTVGFIAGLAPELLRYHMVMPARFIGPGLLPFEQSYPLARPLFFVHRSTTYRGANPSSCPPPPESFLVPKSWGRGISHHI
jgi:hypothetical protein